MSEKRFTMKYSIDDEEYVYFDGDVALTPSQVNKLLNEQQSEINSLKLELELRTGAKLFSRRELERTVKEQQATITELKKDLKTVIDSYDCERIGYCHKGEYCKKWGLNND